ncbi:hypothetical protein EES41_36165 [Streptomyces sp. ADI95-16]|uniref:hypothetical protein n=1 Tax=Streptomyces sp. ADI95-16 TaxID=1522758 RepID=UPI000F3AA367|nr:hypothetical protein [Streptomyces sp. ADI95-16]AYV32194.1 hypothetical protein EES41_36165 [Streptomyces sp. ADI95-16]
MISWGQIFYGAALSAAFALVLLALPRGRRPVVLAVGALAAAAGPIAWNAILRAAHGDQFFTDAPVAVFPVSWQDTGSGVFALAVTALALGLGPLAAEPARRTSVYALLAGAAALLVDVYLY